MAKQELKVAQRKRAKLKLGISAPSGGGKTLGALFIAYGLMKEKYPKLKEEELWSKIAIIDSENGSGELYAETEKANIGIGSYNVISLQPPFTPEKYIDSILLCYDSGIEVCIIDSTSHLWAGQGGLLEQQANITKRTGNSYSAWRDITPEHNRFVDTMLLTDMHIIATMRAKTEYVQEKVDGKTTVRKVGLNPVQRDGMEYEFTAFFEIDAEHNAFGSKDRTSIFDQQTFKISPEIGRKYMKWLDSGVAVVEKPKTSEELRSAVKDAAKTDVELLNETKEEIKNFIQNYVASFESEQEKKSVKAKISETIKSVLEVKGNPSANYNSITTLEKAKEVLGVLKNLIGGNENE